MPNEPLRLSRRVALQSVALASGAVLLAGCKDDQASSGTPGAVDPESGKTVPAPPTVDPAVVAALTTAAGLVNGLVSQYTLIGTKYPALKPKLAAGAKYHASHLAKLEETEGVTTAEPAPPKSAPASAAAALAVLAKLEKQASIAHATAAAKVTGPQARLLAMIAASELQLSSTLLPTKKGASS